MNKQIIHTIHETRKEGCSKIRKKEENVGQVHNKL